jgi:hypothetical protein
VVRAMAEETMRGMYALLDEKRREDTPTLEKLEGYFRTSAIAVGRKKLLPRELLLEIIRTATPPGGGDAEMGKIHAAYQAILAEGQARGDVRTDLSSSFLAEMVFGTFAAIFSNWLNDEKYPLEARARDAIVFLRDALSPRALPEKPKQQRGKR